jgi:sortase A
VGLIVSPSAGHAGQSVTRPEPDKPAAAKASPQPEFNALGHTVLVGFWLLMVIGGLLCLLAAWFVLYALVFSGMQQAHSQHELYASLRSEIALGTAPPFLGSTPSDNIPAGAPVAVLQVPRAGISDVVVEGTTSGVLEQGPGLLRDTALPGQPGTSVILGRQAMFGGPFRNLTSLRRGDQIVVTTGQGTFRYVVTGLRYSGQRQPAALGLLQSRLTLVTAVGSRWRALGAVNKILYVDATLRGKAVADPGGTATSVSSAELIMNGDTSVLLPMLLWLLLLVIVTVAVLVVGRKWGGPKTWVVGAPCILAVLWIASESVFQLLPNLL